MARDFSKEGKLGKFLKSKFFLFCFGFFLVLFFLNMFKFLDKMRETSAGRDKAEARVLELAESKQRLSGEIEKLSTEKGVEDAIRNKFGLGKDGEKMVVVVDEKRDVVEMKAESGNGFWNFFRKFFSDKKE